MTKGHGPDAWNQPLHRGQRLLDEAWNLRQGQGDVVLDAGAVSLLRLGNGLAQLPQGRSLGRAASKGCVGNQSTVQGLRQETFGCDARNCQIRENVPRGSGGQRIRHAIHVLQDQVQGQL